MGVSKRSVGGIKSSLGQDAGVSGGIDPPAKSDSYYRNLRPAKKPYRDFDGDGMYLQVEPSGAKYWRLKYRHNGKEGTYAIGVYPEVSLADARAERSRARAWLKEGKDPTMERRLAKAVTTIQRENTFALLANEWYDKRAPGWSTEHRGAQRSRFDNELLPHLGNIPIKEITPAMCLEVLSRIEARGVHEVAAKCRIMGSQVFRYAVVTSRADTDPFQMLKGALKARPPVKHRATVPHDEMAALFKALNKVPAENVTKLAFCWLVLTVARTKEMRFAPWQEIESSRHLWRIPAERMKMTREHVVPLSTQAQAILKLAEPMRTSEAPDALLFPGFTRHGALSENALLALLARAGYFGRQTAHGFRAAFSTWAHEVEEASPDVIESCLAHQRSDVRSAYNRSQYISKRRQLLQRWADQCTKWGMKLPGA